MEVDMSKTRQISDLRSESRAMWLPARSLPVLVAACLLPALAVAQRKRPLDPIAAKLEPTRIVTYKQVDGQTLNLHVFEPAGRESAERRSAFVIFHGGGWTGGNPRRTYPFADYFRGLGMVSVSVEYRLLNQRGESTVFDCVRDGRSAVRYVRSHAAEFRIDPNRIVASGCSAGGHVAAGTALFDGVDEASDDLSVSCVPDALVLYYPVIDTSTDGYGQQKIGDRWKQISPLHQVRGDLPPTLHFHGTADTVTPYAGAVAFQRRMRDLGNDYDLVSGEGGVHGYLIFDLREYEESMARTRTFLEAHGVLPSSARP